MAPSMRISCIVSSIVSVTCLIEVVSDNIWLIL